VSPAFQLSRVPVRHNETLDFANTGRRQMETTGTSPHDRDASYLMVDRTYPFLWRRAGLAKCVSLFERRC
jgi:hypothetical protein